MCTSPSIMHYDFSKVPLISSMPLFCKCHLLDPATSNLHHSSTGINFVDHDGFHGFSTLIIFLNLLNSWTPYEYPLSHPLLSHSFLPTSPSPHSFLFSPTFFHAPGSSPLYLCPNHLPMARTVHSSNGPSTNWHIIWNTNHWRQANMRLRTRANSATWHAALNFHNFVPQKI